MGFELTDSIRDVLARIHAKIGGVRVDENAGTVWLDGYPFPDGWNADESTILFDLPDTYRSEPPTGVYIPDDLQYKGGYPMFVHEKSSAGPRGYNELCIHSRDLGEHWDPRRHTLITVTRMIDKSLRHPTTGYPWQHRD
ncbi:MAG: E2/UBC family protein [Candidatus Nanohaloarchaea archaeon]|nr:E2/UBC family protein [Candidatus Nanohaloarchaea archaeon]